VLESLQDRYIGITKSRLTYDVPLWWGLSRNYNGKNQLKVETFNGTVRITESMVD